MNAANQICYLCESRKNKTIFIENEIPIVRCLICNHVFSTYKQEEHFENYWDAEESEYDLNWWDTAHREIYKDFITSFLTEPNGKILDVGCGLGFFIKMLQDERPEWEAFGYEISKSAVKFARKRNGLKNVRSGIVQASGLPKESFDIITLWDVLEHIPKPQDLLTYLFTLLKPGGFLFIQTPNFPVQLLKAKLKVLVKGMVSDGHYLEAKDHINDYSEETIKLLSKQCGFSSVDFTILKPIAAVSGSNAKLGIFLKKIYYFSTLVFWHLTFKRLNLNLTLFALLRKN
ncbi:putative methionine biosynthesis protein MetW [Leptospira inadai serovar Lyme str. 10]|uniref:SAM-dependent methyltransferase n=2 Tax=Leptospira inadai serovar Lyme TaxID=293084 RepID=A0ABX4YJY9_9LEPT|nr:class I SAM-dependent methyltransferase [Leptospira inadai]EQA36939.1 putative methionine biosynthesis protein MetW [Leptospira inadai serovar Lyme str. 10]PNV75613.1 SAM-dependent methyltransferase [Leptospira inadai serovar Lyme]